MNALCTFCVLLSFVFIYASGKEFSYNDLDKATQNELDRLIGEALNRQSKGNPNKQEYEKFYNVRKFMMQRVQKSDDNVKTTIKTTTQDPLISTTHRFLSKNWWFNRHSDHPLVSPDDDEEELSKEAEHYIAHNGRAHLNSRYRTFPHLKQSRTWQGKSSDE